MAAPRKRKQTVLVPYEDLVKAYHNFCAYKKATVDHRAHGTFEMFLGVSYAWHMSGQRMAYQAAKKVELLCSPHYHALMKAREARRRKWK